MSGELEELHRLLASHHQIKACDIKSEHPSSIYKVPSDCH